MSLIDLITSKKQIDTNNWKKFKVGSLFEFPKLKKYSKIDKTIGTTPFVSCQSSNNGVSNMCGLVGEIENAITISTNGNNFDCFYHDYKFVPSSDVEVITHNKLNKNIALFICSILKKESKKYTYGKKAKNGAVARTYIKLPVDANGEPDWEYMNNYIAQKEKQIKENVSKLIEKINSKKQINISTWKYFKIGDLFDVTRGKRIVRNKDYTNEQVNENIYPVITPRLKNNGIDGFYSKYNCLGNCIVVGGDVSGLQGFYQSKKCWVVDTSRIINTKENKKITRNSWLFILTIISKLSYLFNFQKKANPSDILSLKIKLPVDVNDEPDWEYMDNYIAQKEKEIKNKL